MAPSEKMLVYLDEDKVMRFVRSNQLVFDKNTKFETLEKAQIFCKNYPIKIIDPEWQKSDH